MLPAGKVLNPKELLGAFVAARYNFGSDRRKSPVDRVGVGTSSEFSIFTGSRSLARASASDSRYRVTRHVPKSSVYCHSQNRILLMLGSLGLPSGAAL